MNTPPSRPRALAVLSLALVLACDERPVPSPEQHALARRMLAGVASRAGFEHELPYRLYLPARTDAALRAPLIVLLHSSGARGKDNVFHLGLADVGQLLGRAQDQEPSFVLAPQCPEGAKWVRGEKHSPHRNYVQSEREESDAVRLTLLLIEDLMKRLPIDPDRVYLIGESSGAAGTWDIITRHEDHPFAAAVPMTGIGDPSRAPVMAKMPIWAFHGALDKGNPPTNSRELVDALRKLESPVRYTEYPDVGHITWDRAFAEPELFSWLFAQRRSSWRAP